MSGVQRPSHCERILALLHDEREHSHHELYALGVIAHSRIAELRGRGYTIAQRRAADADGGAVYLYRLVSGPLSEGEGSAPHGALPSGEIPGSLAPSASGRSFSEEEAGREGAFLGSPSVRPPGRGKESVSFSLSESGQLAWDVAA